MKKCMIIESGSLLAINSLHSAGEDLLELGALFSTFHSNIDMPSTSLPHVYRSINIPTHLLAKVALASNFVQK